MRFQIGWHLSDCLAFMDLLRTTETGRLRLDNRDRNRPNNRQPNSVRLLEATTELGTGCFQTTGKRATLSRLIDNDS
jgi:hypothetical protein